MCGFSPQPLDDIINTANAVQDGVKSFYRNGLSYFPTVGKGQGLVDEVEQLRKSLHPLFAFYASNSFL